MGNHINQLLLIIIGWAFCLSGCSVVNDAQARQQQAMQFYQNQQTQEDAPVVPSRMEAGIHCRDSRIDDCGLLVTLNALDEDIVLDIRLHVDEGIAFLPNLDVLPDDGGAEGVIARVKLIAWESRQIFFPYRPNNPDLPGAYRAIVIATNSETYELFAHNQINAYLVLNEFGEYHLLPSEVEYNVNFKNLFTNGDMGLGYRIVLEGGERPHRGHILVRVDSHQDGFAPVVEVESTGAITFIPDPIWDTNVQSQGEKIFRQFPSMNQYGTRVVKFPFELDRNGRVLDGTYTFVVTLTPNDGTKPQSEKMPIVIQVLSDPQYSHERWLNSFPQEMARVTPTPDALHAALTRRPPGANGIGYGGRAWPDRDEAQSQCNALANVNFSPNYGVPSWSLNIANYNGTLCQAYLTFVAVNPIMSWNEFKEQAVFHNENLASEADSLYDYKVYVMPELD